MKYIITILLVLISIFSKSQVPFYAPTQKINGWIENWYTVPDSGNVIPKRADTNWIPRFVGTSFTWQRPGIDTAVWSWNGFKWYRLALSSDIIANTNIANSSLTANGEYTQNWNGNNLFFNNLGGFFFAGSDVLFGRTNSLSLNGDPGDFSSTPFSLRNVLSKNGQPSQDSIRNEIRVLANQIDIQTTNVTTNNRLGRLTTSQSGVVISSIGGNQINTTAISLDTVDIKIRGGRPNANADSIYASGPYDPLTLSNPVYKVPFPSGGTGTVTSVALSMPSAFSVSGSPITTSGTFSVSGAGTTAQYIRGNGTLATFDTTAIPSFSAKVRSLFSGTSPITYNQATGAFGISDATTVSKGAASFNASNFTVSSGAVSLADVVSAGACTNCDLSVNSKGQITSYSNGAGGGGSTNSNIGSGYRWAVPSTNNIKTVYSSNTIIWDSASNSNGLTAKADTSVLATQYDLTQISVSAAEGVANESNVIKLGDNASTIIATLTTDRYVRGGNKSIYFEGDKVNNGFANLIFNDSLSATAGDPRFKNWLQINSLDHVTPGFHMGTASVDDGTGTNRNNHIMNFGFNLAPNSTRVNPNYCAIGESWEGAFQNLQEMHKFWIDRNDIQHRIESYTIDTSLKTVDKYNQVTSWSLKDVDIGAEPWVDFTGGQGSTGTNFRLYAGVTNQFRLQYGLSVSGGNTTASISTTGPGQTEFHLGIPEGWGHVSLPSFVSESTFNSFSTQALPATDGNLNFGDPTNKWLKINGYYLRAVNGIWIGDYSGDEVPGGLMGFGPNRSLVSYASGAADDAVMLVNNTNGATFGIRNLSPTGFDGIEYIGDDGALKVFTGFNNNNGQEFRFNNIATGGYIAFMSGGNVKLRVNNTGGITLNQVQTGSNSMKVLLHGTDSVVYQMPIVNILGYSKYVGLISQAGTSNPTATVLQNELSSAIAWTRNSAGNYTGTLSGAFTQNKTFFVVTASDETGVITSARCYWSSANTVTLITSADVFTNISVEIRVYP